MSEQKPTKDKDDAKAKDFSSPTGDKLRAEHRRSGLIGTLIAGALGGGAYGIHRSAEGFLPKETRIALDTMEREYSRLQTSRALSGDNATVDDIVRTYATNASRLADAPVAGMKGRELIKLLRTRLPIKNKWNPHFSDAHYDAFARGPAYGAAQIIDETAENAGKYWNPDKGMQKYMLEKFHPLFAKKLNEAATARGAGPMDVGPSLRESLAYRGDTMDAAKQPGMMQEIVSGDRFNKDKGLLFDGFSDHYKKVKGRVANELMTNSFKNYTGVGHKAKGVYNVLHTALPALLGAAGLGAGGYGVYKLIKSLRRTAHEKRMIDKAKDADKVEKSAMVKQEGDEWILYTADGARVLGRHKSAKGAYAQEYAIKKSQEAREKSATTVAKYLLNALDYVPKVKKVVAYTKVPDKLERLDKNFNGLLEAAMAPEAEMPKFASVMARLRKARNTTHTHPTDAQRDAGNYAKGVFKWQGLTIKIENPEGSTRSGVTKDGKAWRTTMKNDYGYFAGNGSAAPVGKDGDAVDVFVGNDLDSDKVAVIDQVIDGKFDEHKVIVGVKDEDDARKTYLANFQKGWKCGPITITDVAGLKKWLASGKTKKEFAKAAAFGDADWQARAKIENEAFDRAVEAMPEGSDKEMAKKGHGVANGSCGCRIRGCRCPSRMHNISLTLDIPCENCATEKKASAQCRCADSADRSSASNTYVCNCYGNPMIKSVGFLPAVKSATVVCPKCGTVEARNSYYDIRNFCPACFRAKSAATAEPPVIGKGLGTLFSDFVPYAPSGARRAGAASLMAERIGEDPSILLKYPMMSQVAAMIGGGAIGKVVHDVTGSVGGGALSALMPWLAVQTRKRSLIHKINREYKLKPRKRLAEIGSDEMVDDAMGSYRLGMAQANDAMRNRKYRDIGAIAEAADTLPVATTMLGFGPAASLPFTQLIDQLESRKFINKQADFSDQLNGPAIPMYLAAAGLGIGGLAMAGKKLHKDLNDPRLAGLPRDEWDGLAKHVSGRDLLSAEVKGLNNAFFARARNSEEARGLAAMAIQDPRNLRKLILNPSGSNLMKQVRENGLMAFDPAFGKGSVVGHEAGHAKIEHSPGILQGLQRHLYQLSPAIAPLSAVGGMAAGLASKSTLGGLLAGTGIGLLGGAGMMFPEYMATHHGMEGLKSYKGGKFLQPGDWQRQLTALATYGSLNVLPAALTGAFGGYIGGRRKKLKEKAEQEAATPDNVIRMDENARNAEKAAALQ